jgi:hypothetical protein
MVFSGQGRRPVAAAENGAVLLQMLQPAPEGAFSRLGRTYGCPLSST